MRILNLTLNIFSEFKFLVMVFLISIISIFSYFTYLKNYKIIDYLDNRNQSLIDQYEVIYENLRIISENTFYGIINKENIFNDIKNAKNNPDKEDEYRKKLYADFLNDYERLKLYRFNIVNFYFNDNRVFLSMNQPNIFDDIFTRFEISNSSLKPINGFEIGKYFDAFRFIYPIYDKELNHIGGVEIAILSKYFEEKFEETNNIDVHFLTKQEVLKINHTENIFSQYIMSNENNEYLYHEQIDEKNHYSFQNFFTEHELKLIKDKMNNSENFYLNKNINSKKIAIFFLPISNLNGDTNSTYMIIYEDSKPLKEIDNNYEKVILILFYDFVKFFHIDI